MDGDVNRLETLLRNEMKRQEAIMDAKFNAIKAEFAGLKWRLAVIAVFVLASFVLFAGK
ncbi:hypothetical protein AGMMS49521_2590 [Campylobacterota bacterium]|nr:hypothetical protein AGMMS49521_2480 [Campylobacterota bacterium]GHV01769.1 hypothetical protein AGMMS49521_2590 [Campylobacterota bacterium]